MEYNSQRETLLLPQYGRILQGMVEYCCNLDDRDQRQACAEAIVAVMAILNPDVKKQANYHIKLWQQLAIISNYKLDIDYPVEISTQQELAEKPKRVPYPTHSIRQRHYGYITEAMLNHLQQMEPSAEREELVAVVANTMKRDLYNWNYNAMDDNKVRTDIAGYTNGNVELSSDIKLTAMNGPRASEESTKKKRKKK
ncbi:MAG: DUF4290 domain-containing protein [Bacteroidaceae bacterium]|nr:DUF4290 domain-containing protein [Bacteroidaceae bacterium]